MFLRRVSIPVVLILTFMLQFLPGTAFGPRPVAAACTNWAQFISDGAVVDGTTFTPGFNFDKTWTLKNTGTCTWTGYSAVFYTGYRMGATSPVYLPTVNPGASVTIHVPMTAPSYNGHFRGNWKLQNNWGVKFGVGGPANYLFWVDIYVNSTYTPGTTCNRGAFVQDVTYQDGYVMAPDTHFTKTWRITNVGSCPWDATYDLVFVFGSPYGTQMGPSVVPLPASIAPNTPPVLTGQTRDFSVDMVAPHNQGHYRSYYRFQDGAGHQFGVGSGMVTFFADIYVSNTVTNPTSTMSITDNHNPSTPGQSVTLTATVSGNNGTPTGSVNITGLPSTCNFQLNNGTGTCNVVFSSVGIYPFTATFTGNGNYNGITNTVNQTHTVSTVITPTSTMTITANPEPSAPGQSVTLSATVSGNSGTPTGSVNIPGLPSTCNFTLNNGTGACTVVFSSVGIYSFTATFTGTGTYAGVTSNVTQTHTVATPKAASAIVIQSTSPNPSLPGGTVVVSYKVNGAGSPLLTGFIDISGADDNTNCTHVPLPLSGSGTCGVVFNTAGTRTLTATYEGDTNYLASTSSPYTHTVNKGVPTTTITAHDPNPSLPNHAITVSVKVIGGGVTPTGTVDITGGDTLCTINLSPLVTGTATGSCNTVVWYTIGTKHLTATYNGDGNYQSSSSLPITHYVKNASQTTVTALPDTTTPGPLGPPASTVTLQITVTGIGSTVTLTGTVDITGTDHDTTGLVLTPTVPGTATASWTVNFLTAGPKIITATYSGDGNYAGSSGSATHNVARGTPTVSIISVLPTPFVHNQSEMVTVHVTGAGAPPTGTVSISISNGQTSTCSFDATDTPPSCPIQIDQAGTFTITATYAGDNNYLGATNAPPWIQVVN